MINIFSIILWFSPLLELKPEALNVLNSIINKISISLFGACLLTSFLKQIFLLVTLIVT